MRKFYFLLLTVLLAAITTTNAQVSVTATAGTLGPTPYTNLSSAFTAINAGTHQGNITVDITASFTDAAVSVLNSSGAGSASYTSVLIRPTADGVTMSFATATGRGVIELNGADNVTIDGDNPNTGGTNRNLTITNTAANTITFTSVIRLASSTLITTNDNVTIKNCNLNGSGTARNTAAFTTEATTWGIIAGGSASTAAATTAPTALASATTTIASGQTALNFIATNNAVTTCSRGISFNGAAITVCPILTITNNLIGNSSVGATNQVYVHGISAQGFNTGTTISGNTVYVESWIGTALIGIDNGTISANGTNGIIEKNIIGRVVNNSTSGFGAYGINLASTTAPANNTVRNNFVTQVINSGTASFSTTFGVFGIRIATGTNNKIYHNSVNLFGNNPGTGSNLMACFGLVSTTSTGTDVRNNIFSNTADQSGVGAVSANVCVYLPTSATVALNLTWNNNAYFTGTIAGKSGVAHIGTTYTAVPAGPATYAGLYTAANFNPGLTSPNTNFRVYTSILNAAGTNDNSSFATTAAAPFTSATDLHIPIATSSLLESGGATVGVTTDIDGDVRPGPAGSVNGGALAPDMGADEFDGVFTDVSAPLITYTPATSTCTTGDRIISGVTISDLSGVPTAGSLRPRIYYRKNAGSYFSQPGTLSGGTGTNGTWDFTIVAADMGGVATGDVISYYIIAQDISAGANIASNPGGVIATNVNTVTTHPATPNTYIVGGTLGGTYTVGAGGNFATLTAAVAIYNSNCGLTGPVVFNLIDAAYPSETFPITINQNPSASAVNTLTIKPAATSTVSGSVNNGAIIRVLGNYITIDGSNSGGSTRDLTLANTSTTGPSVILYGSTGAVPITNSGLKNCIVINGANTATAVVVSDGATLGSAGNFNNIIIQNNNIQRAYIGVYSIANVVAGNGSGLLITGNQLNTAGANSIRLTALYVQGVDGATVSNNTIGNIANTLDAANITGVWFATSTVNSTISGNTITGMSGTLAGPRGIAISTGLAASNVTVSGNTIAGLTSSVGSTTLQTMGVYVFVATGGVTVSGNKIRDVKNTNGVTSVGSYGINLASTVTGANINVNNNFVSDVASLGSATVANNGHGIIVSVAGSGYSIYYNSVHLNTNQTAVAGIPSAMTVTSAVTAAGAINLRDNIFSNSQTIGTERYAIYSGAANTVFAAIDYNDYYSAGPNLGFIGSNRVNLAAIQAGFGGNLNSQNILPVFLTPTDLHLNAALNGALDNLGIPIGGITVDIDGDTRVAPTDMGADEFSPCAPPASATAGSNSPVCDGSNINLTGTTDGTTFLWTGPNGFTSTLQNPSLPATSAAAGVYYFVAFLAGCPSPVSNVTVVVNTMPSISSVTATPSTICYNGNSQLNVSANSNLGYVVSPVPFAPIASGSGTVTLASAGVATTALTAGSLDDGYWNGISIPFSFTYYGTAYNTIHVQTNGIASFTALGATTGYGSSPQMPNTATPNNILGVFADMEWRFGGVISTYTSGSAPNRIFVINYDGSTGGGFYNAGLAPTALVNYQIQLFENGNKIQFHTTSITTDASHNHTMGIENAAGTAATVVPGRDNSLWSLASDGTEISQSPVTYLWSPSTFLNNSTIANPIASNVTTNTTYTVTVTSPNGCAVSGMVTVTLDPEAFNVTGGGSFCPGGSGVLVGLDGSQTGVNYQLFEGVNPVGAPVAGTGASISFGLQTTVGTYTVVATNTSTACTRPMTGSAVVANLPAPILSQISVQPTTCVSNDGSIDLTVGGAAGPYTYNWSTIGGSGLVNGLEDQTGLSVGQYTVVVTSANGCQSTLVIGVPGPGGCSVCPTIGSLATNPTPTVCANNPVILTADGLTSMGVTYGIEFKYSASALADPYAGGTTIATVPNGSLTAGGTIATASTSFPAGGNYFIYAILSPAPSDPLCRPFQVVSLTVYPTPNAVATPPSQTICSGSAITTIALSGAVPATTYNWTRDNTGSVTGIAASGSGNISGALTNTTAAPVTVTFTITPTANGCPGTPITATVLVNPTPVAVATPSSQTSCSGQPITTIVLSSATSGTTFAWTRNNTATVTGIAASGAGNISGTLTNTTNAPITVTFTITPTANGCPGAPITATVIVNPTPTILTGSMQVIVTGVGEFADEITWTLTNSLGAVVLSGGPYGFNPPATASALVPATNGPFSFFIEAQGTFNDNGLLWEVRCGGNVVASGCIRGTASFFSCPNSGTLTVPGIAGCGSNIAPQTICSGSAIAPITFSGGVAGTVFNWVRNNTATVTGIAASGTGNITGTLTNTTSAPVVVTFTVTPSANGCNGTPVNVPVTVNPTPTAVATPASQTMCSGTAITPIVLSGAVAGTTYAWTRNNTATVTGIAASGSGNISGTLTNTTTLPVTVTFTITPTANGCPGTPITATVTVNPLSTIVCPANITVPSVVGGCTAVVNYAPTVTGTPTPTLTYVFSGATTGSGSGSGSGSAFNVGVTTVTITATNICSIVTCAFTVTVTDSQLPVISSQPATVTSCVGNNVTFSVTSTNVLGYQWQLWNGTAWVNVSGATSSSLTINNITLAMNTNSYRVILTGLCTVVTSNAATLFVNSLPIITINSSLPPALIPGQLTTLTATGIPPGGSFVWLFNGVVMAGVTGNVLTDIGINNQGSYQVRYTAPTGCVSTSAPLVITGMQTEIMWVYPNPNPGRFQVRYYNQNPENATVNVYNAGGSKVFSKTVVTTLPYTMIEVDLGPTVAAGPYVVELVNQAGKRVGAKTILVRPQ